MAEVMAMGLPIITNPGWGDVDHLVSNGARIILYTENSALRFHEIPTFSDNSDFVKRYLSLSAATDVYAQMYQRLGA